MHYLLLVISDKSDGWKEKLKPFQENACDEYLSFVDYTKETISWYQENLEENTREYGDVGNFAKRYFGYTTEIVNGAIAYGCMVNLNAKWDWYQLGGRYPGRLVLKEGITKGTQGEPTLLGDAKFHKSAYADFKGRKRVDGAQIKDIDWEMTKEYYRAVARKDWDEIQDMPLTMKRWYLKDPNTTVEEYISIRGNITSYAVLTKDGVWYTKEDFTDGNWSELFFKRFIENLDPSMYITFVDCHI